MVCCMEKKLPGNICGHGCLQMPSHGMLAVQLYGSLAPRQDGSRLDQYQMGGWIWLSSVPGEKESTCSAEISLQHNFVEIVLDQGIQCCYDCTMWQLTNSSSSWRRVNALFAICWNTLSTFCICCWSRWRGSSSSVCSSSSCFILICSAICCWCWNSAATF